MPLSDGDLVDLLHETGSATAKALRSVEDWGLAGTRSGQHHSDIAADAAALAVLEQADVGVLSEESGWRDAHREVVVVVDPLDGSTNAARGIPWYAVSLCAVDRDGPRVALVVDIPRGRRYNAVRGAGAWVDSCDVDASTRKALYPTECRSMGEAVVGLSGFPGRWLGWKQYRALGAAALDLCAVAEGVLDAYIDCSPSAHGPWDYLAGVLICQEAGAVAGDAEGRDLLRPGEDIRRTPIAAATADLYATIPKLLRKCAL